MADIDLVSLNFPNNLHKFPIHLNMSVAWERQLSPNKCLPSIQTFENYHSTYFLLWSFWTESDQTSSRKTYFISRSMRSLNYFKYLWFALPYLLLHCLASKEAIISNYKGEIFLWQKKTSFLQCWHLWRHLTSQPPSITTVRGKIKLKLQEGGNDTAQS